LGKHVSLVTYTMQSNVGSLQWEDSKLIYFIMSVAKFKKIVVWGNKTNWPSIWPYALSESLQKCHKSFARKMLVVKKGENGTICVMWTKMVW
jgi:hypothetical protein